MSKLVLFTNSYPYGTGETFLHEELPIVAQKFSKIVIFPLYIPSGKIKILNTPMQSIPENVTVMPPLIAFDHKDKKGLIINGIIPKPFLMEIYEFFNKGIFLSRKKLWIYFNYTLLLNSILGNRKVMNEVKKELEQANVAYFYWGDKSALIIPYIKKMLKNPPPFVVRFHGSDIYEEAKGYLPYRNKLYSAIDYAVPISNNGAEYIKLRYKNSQPTNIKLYRLGSYMHEPVCIESNDIFHIVSCSNVIELKRVEIIAKALINIEKDFRFIERMVEAGYKKIKWTHIGDGPLLENVKEIFRLGNSLVTANFPGRLPHEKVMEFYSNNRVELFVQVSSSEGIPVSIMEALSYGIPVITTNVGGVEELFPQAPNCPYGTLLPKELTVSDLEKVIKKFILIPDNEIEHARAAARKEWEINWNCKKNYSDFAEFLAHLATLSAPTH